MYVSVGLFASLIYMKLCIIQNVDHFLFNYEALIILPRAYNCQVNVQLGQINTSECLCVFVWYLFVLPIK